MVESFTMFPDITLIARLMSDPTRAKMLVSLMAGKALTATELAVSAGITPQTASSHLKKMVHGKLLAERKQGRHKYFQLKNSQIAQLIETLLCLSTIDTSPEIHTGPHDTTLRKARICYDHLAGEIAVSLYQSLLQKQYITDHDEMAQLTPQGEKLFQRLGMPLDDLRTKPRPLCKPCLDWSERRNHLAGSLGKWVLHYTLTQGWAHRDLNSRAIHFSTSGLQYFISTFKI